MKPTLIGTQMAIHFEVPTDDSSSKAGNATIKYDLALVLLLTRNLNLEIFANDDAIHSFLLHKRWNTIERIIFGKIGVMDKN